MKGINIVRKRCSSTLDYPELLCHPADRLCERTAVAAFSIWAFWGSILSRPCSLCSYLRSRLRSESR
jgi:hypothetical protein